MVIFTPVPIRKTPAEVTTCNCRSPEGYVGAETKLTVERVQDGYLHVFTTLLRHRGACVGTTCSTVDYIFFLLGAEGSHTQFSLLGNIESHVF